MKSKYVLTEYTVPAGLPKKLTLGLVSDLHECVPDEILELLRQGNPDFIMVAGDTFERHGKCKDTQRGMNEGLANRLIRRILMKLDDLFECIFGEWKHDPEDAYRFLRDASRIAPVFLSLGNHEWYLRTEDLKVLEENGAILLDNADSEICIEGSRAYIGGLSSMVDLEWLDEFCAKAGYKILLCHHPEYYDQYLKDKRIDLILSGHAHGGQIRIGNKGIFSPGQGLFPEYTKGIYDGRLVVTTGASNTASVPRWGNPCEVVMIHLE